MTIEFTVPTDQWIQITTTGEAKGSLYCQDQGSSIALTESETLPTTEVSDTPLSNVIKQFEAKGFFGLGTANFLYARALNKPTRITVSISD
jgi:hypothetical protein